MEKTCIQPVTQHSRHRLHSMARVTLLAAGLGLAGLAQAANPMPLTHGFAKPKPLVNPHGVTAPAPRAPVRALCSALSPISFRIVGKVPVTGSGGDHLYKLRLQGVVQNAGDGVRGRLGELSIVKATPGARGRVISHLSVQNLGHGKRVMIGALTQPLSPSTEFLPQYHLNIKNVRGGDKACQLKRRSQIRMQPISRSMIQAALRP